MLRLQPIRSHRLSGRTKSSISFCAACWREAEDVDLAPSEQFLKEAFITAHGMFVLAVSEYVALARPEKQPVADKIQSDFNTAWKN
jgi:hypothetical protein